MRHIIRPLRYDIDDERTPDRLVAPSRTPYVPTLWPIAPYTPLTFPSPSAPTRQGWASNASSSSPVRGRPIR